MAGVLCGRSRAVWELAGGPGLSKLRHHVVVVTTQARRVRERGGSELEGAELGDPAGGPVAGGAPAVAVEAADRLDGGAGAPRRGDVVPAAPRPGRSEEHTSELPSLMRISYAVFCLKKKTSTIRQQG